MPRPIYRVTLLLALLLFLGALITTASLPLYAQDNSIQNAAVPEFSVVPQPETPFLAQQAMPIPPFTPGVVLVGMQGDVVVAADMAGADVPWRAIEVIAVEPLDLRNNAASVAGATSQTLTGYQLTVPVGTEWTAVETLLARTDVVFAEPDWLARAAQTDPAYESTEVPFTVPDSLYPEQWYLQRVGLSRAWAAALSYSPLQTINVTVIDTGVDFTHPDLANRVSAGRNYLNPSATAMDDNGHGTHVSGLIAAAANNAGMVGAGWQVTITPYKALNSRGFGGVNGIAQALRDAADNGADIINMSLELSQDASVLREAIAYAASKGVLLIAASGNQSSLLVSYPAAYPNVMAVGATTYFDRPAPYSNQGPELDIVAPGGDLAHLILSTWTRDFGAPCASGLRQVNGGLYCGLSGTSMATAVATGGAALIWSLRPDLDAGEVEALLLDSAFAVDGSANEIGRGRMDLARAVRLALYPRLQWQENPLTVTAMQSDAPVYRTITLANPSAQRLTVEVAPMIKNSWFDVVGAQVGEVSYDAPLDVRLIFTPTAVGLGMHMGELQVRAFDEQGGESVYLINIRFDVHRGVVGDARLLIPWVGYRAADTIWAAPAHSSRVRYTVPNDGSIVVNLPFALTVSQQTYRDLRIFADGFVVASSAAFPPNLPTHCLANQSLPSLAIYGWWDDLSLDANSAISTFQPTAESFVAEYSNLISLASSEPDDRVSFQIVLGQDGHIELNYEQVPEHTPRNLTVGVSAADGRFYNQVTCYRDGATRFGETPRPQQSIIFRPEELY